MIEHQEQLAIHALGEMTQSQVPLLLLPGK